MDANAMHLAAYRRALAVKGRSKRTYQNYEETILQLAEFHDGADVLELEQSDVEEYIVSVLAQAPRRRRGEQLLPGHVTGTAANRFRALRAFFNWAVTEERIDGPSPMARMKTPTATDAAPPVPPDEHVAKLLKACQGKDFDARRDLAIVRLFCEAGSPRVAEMAGMLVDGSLDLRRDMVKVMGKGGRIREIPFGPKTGQAFDRYLPVRNRHALARRPELWLGARGMALTPSGIAQMLQRRCEQAKIPYIHPHLLRHGAANAFFEAGGNPDEAMDLFGWKSPEMPLVYGRTARTSRAQKTARRVTIADRF
jgi:site-specific recombinase XerC